MAVILSNRNLVEDFLLKLVEADTNWVVLELNCSSPLGSETEYHIAHLRVSD